MNRFADWYYTPRWWERRGNGQLYRWLGITTYKRFLPTTGDLMRQRRGLKQVDPTRSSRHNELILAEKRTRRYEWRHWIGCVIFIVLMFLVERHFSALEWVFLITLNLGVNVYPIMLQRFNRVRILGVLERYF